MSVQLQSESLNRKCHRIKEMDIHAINKRIDTSDLNIFSDSDINHSYSVIQRKKLSIYETRKYKSTVTA